MRQARGYRELHKHWLSLLNTERLERHSPKVCDVPLCRSHSTSRPCPLRWPNAAVPQIVHQRLRLFVSQNHRPWNLAALRDWPHGDFSALQPAIWKPISKNGNLHASPPWRSLRPHSDLLRIAHHSLSKRDNHAMLRTAPQIAGVLSPDTSP
jgi:hypothetical protein